MQSSDEQLFDAVVAGDVSSVEHYLQQGASCSSPNPKYYGLSALDKALELKSGPIIQLLLVHLFPQSPSQNIQLLTHSVQRCLHSKSLSLSDSKSSADLRPCENGHAVDPDGIPLSSHVHEYVLLSIDERVEQAVEAFRRGEFLVVMDSEDRENEGDLIVAAEKATPEKIAFMVNNTSGIICVGMSAARVDELQLPQMVKKNTESHGTAFTHSVDYKVGTTTGISAADRAATIRALVDPSVQPDDFSRPGHVFPLRAREGGVLERPGHTEASVDLATLAGLAPAGALCELVNKDGSMSRGPVCKRFAAIHGLQWLTIHDLIAYRKLHPLATSPSR